MTRRWCGYALVLLAVMAWPQLGAARVNVDIGINLPGAPQLVPVPSSPVLYAPAGPPNYFFFAGQYYVFTNGVWYVGRGYNGPWVVVSPAYVPLPLLSVPIHYYLAPPRAWHGWRREAPPRWEPRWGQRWQERNEHGHQPNTHEHRGGPDGRNHRG